MKRTVYDQNESRLRLFYKARVTSQQSTTAFHHRHGWTYRPAYNRCYDFYYAIWGSTEV